MSRKMKVPKLIIKEEYAPKPKVDCESNQLPSAISQQCATCKFWTGSARCRAFPNGIPQSLLKGKRDHTQPYPGDRGFRYRPA